jgi:hypothetical protein
MKVFTLLENFSERFFESAYQENFDMNPQEDFFLVSKKFPIFSLADGVTREHDEKGKYPDPSPAAELAGIFCQAVISEAEKLYPDFNMESLKQIFKIANQKAGDFNRLKGFAKDKTNFWDFDLVAATGAYAVIKDKKLFWSVIGDCYVAVFGKDGKLKFKSPDPWGLADFNHPDNWDKLTDKEQRIYTRKFIRNGVNQQNELIGYGVATGEITAERYLKYGELALEKNDLVFLVTDGYEKYLNLPELIKLFVDWPLFLKNKVKALSRKLSEEDPEKYGHERTIIVVKI